MSLAHQQHTMSCLTAADGSALALSRRVPGTFRSIKQEIGHRNKKVVRAPKSKLSFLTWEEDAEVRVFKDFLWLPWEWQDTVVPSQGPAAT